MTMTTATTSQEQQQQWQSPLSSNGPWPPVMKKDATEVQQWLERASQSVQKETVPLFDDHDEDDDDRGKTEESSSSTTIEFYWQLPPPLSSTATATAASQENNSTTTSTTTTTAPARALLFLAHGMNHAGTDWWPRGKQFVPTDDDSASTTATNTTTTNKTTTNTVCLGLPEERAIVELARQEFRMITIAMTFTDPVRGWNAVDGPRVAKVLQWFQNASHLFLCGNNDNHRDDNSNDHNRTQRIPTFAFGASSGGEFVHGYLPLALQQIGARYDGYICQIMPPTEPQANDDTATTTTTTTTTPLGRPPAVFITMPQDIETLDQVQSYVVANKQQTSDKNNVKHFPVPDYSMMASPLFFHERIPHAISPDLSRQLTTALFVETMVDATTGKLVVDPRESEPVWKPIVRPILERAGYDPQDQLMADESPIYEVLNVAYGMHEMTRDGVAPALEWLFSTLNE